MKTYNIYVASITYGGIPGSALLIDSNRTERQVKSYFKRQGLIWIVGITRISLEDNMGCGKIYSIEEVTVK